MNRDGGRAQLAMFAALPGPPLHHLWARRRGAGGAPRHERWHRLETYKRRRAASCQKRLHITVHGSMPKHLNIDLRGLSDRPSRAVELRGKCKLDPPMRRAWWRAPLVPWRQNARERRLVVEDRGHKSSAPRPSTRQKRVTKLHGRKLQPQGLEGGRPTAPVPYPPLQLDNAADKQTHSHTHAYDVLGHALVPHLPCIAPTTRNSTCRDKQRRHNHKHEVLPVGALP